jgi:Uma2 family endonuclease
MSTATLMTAEQFAQMKFGETEDYELVEGELIPLSSGTPRHGRIRDRLAAMLWSHFGRDSMGGHFTETDCQLTPNTVRRPDVSVFLGERWLRIDPDHIPIPFAPDIAVEILSPSESAIDVNRKALEYLRAGSQEVWLLDRENCEVFVQTDAGIRLLRDSDRLESPLLPGFSQTVTDLLAW